MTFYINPHTSDENILRVVKTKMNWLHDDRLRFDTRVPMEEYMWKDAISDGGILYNEDELEAKKNELKM